MADEGSSRAAPPEGAFDVLRGWLRAITGGREEVRSSLETLFDERREEDTPIGTQERQLLQNILKLHTQTVANVMVHRVDIVALDVDLPFDEAVKAVIDQGHSRYPVYRETLDDVIGLVHIKDLVPSIADRRPTRLASLVRKTLFVAPSTPVLDLLLQMRLARVHMAMVVDEFGGIDGLVTIEDLIEEIVGEIEDEHDDADTPKIIQRSDGTYLADARAPITALEEALGFALLGEEIEEVDTLGGLVFTLAGRVPARGETVRHEAGLSFEVLDADPRRIKRLRVRRLVPPAEEREHG